MNEPHHDRETSHWQLVYEDYDPKQETLREALCTLGNGYFATRGAAAESHADGVHYPGTYLAGGYNRADTEMAGRVITNEDLVNFPNWLCLSFRIDGGAWFDPGASQILDFRQVLDMHHGILERQLTVRDQAGKETRLSCRRLVHIANAHLAAQQYEITPLNWSGPIEIRSALDGGVVNSGVPRYQDLNNQHLEVLEGRSLVDGEPGSGLLLRVRTLQSRLEMVQAARTRVFRDGQPLNDMQIDFVHDGGQVAQHLHCSVAQHHSTTVEKVVTVYTSRDPAISEPADAAMNNLLGAGDFEALLYDHRRHWEELWRLWDIELGNSEHQDEQMVLRLHIFHMLQSVSVHSTDLDVGVTARGLHGEAYRGHVFWDELFIFPFYNYRAPEITRSLLLYRYRRIEQARVAARKAGFRGAMYPWQSGSDGREETQELHLNPRSGEWGDDYSRYQRHINIAVAYNVWQYFRVSGDWEFMAMYGAEMLLEIARFWASATTFNMDTGRYEIHGVMGPDEYHERYPDSKEPGLKNNAYTNIMAVWVLERANQILELLEPTWRSNLIQRLDIAERERERWRDITRKMCVPLLSNGLIAQFEGYDQLQEFDWEGYRQKYGNIERLDRILKSESDSPDRYQLSKQADVLMLFYLLPTTELERLLQQLGYDIPEDATASHVNHYYPRTSHGSTLSKVVHAAVVDQFDRDSAWTLFRGALRSDIDDIQGGTTAEGIHLGAMAGSVNIVLCQYAGVDFNGEIIDFSPRIPAALSHIRLRVRHRHSWYNLMVNHQGFELSVESHCPVTVSITGQHTELDPGQVYRFPVATP